MLPALSLAVALALGVGAADSNVVIVKIDGKETRLTLAGVSGGSERGTAFAQCLVAGRVLRVSGPHSAAKVTLLDDTAVSAHIAEFLGTQTSSDPCTLGKAAYQPKAVRAAAAPLPVVTKKKQPVREIHVSFPGGQMSKDSVKMSASYPVPPPPSTYQPPVERQPSNQPTYANPPTAQTYTPPTTQATAPQAAGTTSGLAPTSAQQGLPQQKTETMQQGKTETIPTTTYSPPN
jgi:hypothetical protein